MLQQTLAWRALDEWTGHSPRAAGHLRLALLALGYLAFAALAVWTAPARGQAAPLIPYEMMDEGGLFVPSDRPGYVVPSTTVDTDVDIDVSGLIVRARVRQTFVNPSADWVEGVYVFPLPQNAAVDRLRMVIGERVVEGEIMEREAARQAYEQAADAGQQASLVSQQRPNLFTNAVANIPPGDQVVIEIEYQHELSYRDGAFDLRFPMVVLPRYIPGAPVGGPDAPQPGTGWSHDTGQVPDASQITPPVAAPGSGPVNPVDLTVTLDPGFPVEAIESPFHPIETSRNGDGTITVTLAAAETYASRDFELIWRPAPVVAPTAGVFSQSWQGADYHLIMLMPPQDQSNAAPPTREVVFIIDVSGSMAGQSIGQARQALSLALGQLDARDRFNVIAFSDRANALFPEARPATAETVGYAQRYVATLSADGGTEMAAALNLALDGRTDLERLRQIVFITDGAVGNEAALFAMIADRIGASRLFTVGIGSAPNSFFMAEAAAAGRGSFTHIGSTDQVARRMQELTERLASPALTDIRIEWPAGAEPVMYPARIPDLYAGEPVVLTARLPSGTNGTVTVEGRRGEGHWRADVPLATGRDHPGVAGLWARRQITELERQRYDGAPDGEIRQAILRVALDHQIVSEATSLVAIDDTIVRPQGSELTTEPVATNMPDGVDMTMAAAPSAPVDQLSSQAAVRNFARTGSVQVAQLPNTATWSEILMLSGGGLMVVGGLLAWLTRRRWRVA